MKYPHLLQGILDGKQIQDAGANGTWINVTEEHALRVMSGGGGEHLRVKPEPKPNTSKFLLATMREGVTTISQQTAAYKANVKLIFDGETNELIEVRQRDKPSPTRMEECLKTIWEHGGSHNSHSSLIRTALEV